MIFPASNVIFPYNKSRQHQDVCAKLMDMNIEKQLLRCVEGQPKRLEAHPTTMSVTPSFIAANDIE